MGTTVAPSPRESDAALLWRSGRRDIEAFEALVERHREALTSFLIDLTGDPAAAEDLTQETFFAAFRHAGTFQGRSGVRTWLFAIARHAAATWRRRRLREAARIESRQPPADPDPVPWEGETGEVVRSLLEDLPGKLRETVILCDLQGLSYEEAAAALRCPVKTVSTRLFRARERMAERVHSRRDGSLGPPPARRGA